jgi:hypothetical protein
MIWTGPHNEDLDPSGRLRQPVPPERWPFGPPSRHQDCCLLRGGELFCDCAASDASDEDWGVTHDGPPWCSQNVIDAPRSP